MRYEAHRAPGPLLGEIRVPGDKSISHRAVLFSAMADGVSHLTGVLESADVSSTIEAVQALGARVVRDGSDTGSEQTTTLSVTGWGAFGPTHPSHAIDCGNSGTTARLLLGVLAGWPITAVLEGDESLSARPMSRVTDPLKAMGAAFETQAGTLPVKVRGGNLAGIDYASPVASAQVKSAVLLAGLRASGRTTVREPAPSRDHTERLLPAFGVDVGRDPAACTAWVDGPATPVATDLVVPGDPSSAAFFVVAALMTPGSDVRLPNVALNPTRAGFMRVLERMGADVSIATAQAAPGASADSESASAEPVGSIRACHTPALLATVVREEDVPSLIDEVPILALLATQSTGTTRFEGVGELRVKESDRLAAVEEGLRALGATVESGPDWLEVAGPTALGGAELDSLGDHRLAMTWAVAGLVAHGAVIVDRFEAVDVSYPAFARDLASLGVGAAEDGPTP